MENTMFTSCDECSSVENKFLFIDSNRHFTLRLGHGLTSTCCLLININCGIDE